jgi:CheY-like chemotaxis protein
MKATYLMQDFAQKNSPVSARPCGVLVADDEPAIRDVLDFGLQREGFSVWLAADGQEALDLYRSHSEAIDVALLDVLMPRLDGPRTLAALQALTPQIPCCFMSGYLGTYETADLRTRGARAFLAKPFLLPDAVQMLRTLTGDEIGLGRGTAGRVGLGNAGNTFVTMSHAARTARQPDHRGTGARSYRR